MGEEPEQAMAFAIAAIERVWEEVRRSALVQRDLGLPIDRLPDIGEDAVVARSERAAAALKSLERVYVAALPHDLALSVAVARISAARIASEGRRYWLAIDPLGTGFFALFGPTAYGGGFLLNHANSILGQFQFEGAGDLDRYLGLVEDYARLVDQLRLRTEGQAKRGIRIPAPQLERSIELFARLRASAQALRPALKRLATIDSAAAAQRIEERMAASVDPAFVRLLALLDDPDYRRLAPNQVGLSQYPGGDALYRELVCEHTTLETTPERVHAEGLERVAAVRQAFNDLQIGTGFSGSIQDYWRAVGEDPAWRADNAVAIGSLFQRYIDRIAPKIDSVFRFKPRASYRVDPLPSELSGSMTFGYYDPPSPAQPVGRYMFNAHNLASASLINVAALNYHELVPGHHFHVASQRENEALHPIRAHAFINAFNEGWAEYAATLAGELGMYAAPEERFGRLMMDAFLTCRLVVDTGMNALGWSLERARAFMRENAFIPEQEVRSESLRYSCDIPGQSLAYKVGEHQLIAAREEMRARLTADFDIRDFHDAVLKPGALPLPLVVKNIERALPSEPQG